MKIVKKKYLAVLKFMKAVWRNIFCYFSWSWENGFLTSFPSFSTSGGAAKSMRMDVCLNHSKSKLINLRLVTICSGHQISRVINSSYIAVRTCEVCLNRQLFGLTFTSNWFKEDEYLFCKLTQSYGYYWWMHEYLLLLWNVEFSLTFWRKSN